MRHENSARDRLVETAARLFQRQGYAATGLSQILQESGVPKGSLYYYFPKGKEALAVAAVEYIRETISERLKARLSEYEDPDEAVLRLLESAADALSAEYDSIRLCTVALIAMEASFISEPVRIACMETVDAWACIFRDKFIAGGCDPERAEELGRLVQMMVDEALVCSLIKGNFEPFGLVKKYLPRLTGRE